MTGALWLYGAALMLCTAGSVAACSLPRSRVAASIGWFGIAAGVCAFAAGALALALPEHAVGLWTLPTLGVLAISVTHLGGFFTCIAGLVTIPVALYTSGYLRYYEGRYSLRTFAVGFYALVAAGTAVFACGDLVTFFIAWELAAILSSALVAYEWREGKHAKAAYVMIAMGEAGTLAALIAMIIALRGHSLVFAYGAGSSLTAGAKWAVFLLSFFGFGVKAGIVPLNAWLPRAYPVAPGSISALLSTVILNLGVYGLLLVNLDLVPVSSIGCGIVVLIVGALSAIVGILYATVEDDLKTLLAYSSIENVGIAIVGFGAAFVFVAMHETALAAIGLAAGLYHVLNQSVYKALLFLSASNVQMALGERSIDRLGGLIRFMPVTAFGFFIGALSIAAIPPFNGFASEWLTLETLLRSAEFAPAWLRVTFSLSGAVIALTAALAITCFVKAFGMAFLGISRVRTSGPTVDVVAAMRWPLYLLASFCAILGFLPTFVLVVIDRTLSTVLQGSWVQRTLVPAFYGARYAPNRLPADFIRTFHALGAQLGYGIVPGRGLVIMLRGGTANPVVFAMSSTYMVLTLLVLLATLYYCVRVFTRRRRVRRTAVWAGGLSSLLPVMTYTGTGFSNPVRVIFDAVFKPARRDERVTIHEHFREAIRRGRHDVFLSDRLVGRPLISAANGAARRLALMHHGKLGVYVLYAFFTLLAALAIGIWL